MKEIKIYTDGSCLGNPGPGGWAAVIIINGKETEIAGGEKETTNNRMEMMAIIEALKYIRQNKLEKEKIDFFIDSNLVVQTLTSGWKKKKNKDLWAEIEKLSAWMNITWQWVKAHHEDDHNIRADQLAVSEAKEISKQP